ncbi:TetR/AcrR family transcriptional regulator [Microbacterium sp. BWT-B31]|uniref:TetR/AcrR family transcriptional regulator n=1 Tax=Microbacterium sp. BWT-B31 TaxID=3232072 RepID=UPI0035282404
MTSLAGPKRRPAGRKQDILSAARSLFVERGYPSVTMAMIADRVGITAGALYRHHRSKSELLVRVFEESFRHLTRPLPAESLEDAFDNLLSLEVASSSVAELWRREARYLPQEPRDAILAALFAWVGQCEQLIRSARPELSSAQVSLLSWALQSVLVMPASVAQGVAKETVDNCRYGSLHAIERTDLEPMSVGPTTQDEACFSVRSTRERLLLSAISRFGENGFRDTSMTEIGADVGVTGPNLYQYFSSKADLFQAAYARCASTAWTLLGQAASRAASPEQIVRSLVVEHVRLGRLWAQTRFGPFGNDDVNAFVHRERAEYVSEWVHTVQAARPALDRGAAQVRVQIALTLIDDMLSTRFLARQQGFAENLASIASAVLLDDLDDAR